MDNKVNAVDKVLAGLTLLAGNTDSRAGAVAVAQLSTALHRWAQHEDVPARAVHELYCMAADLHPNVACGHRAEEWDAATYGAHACHVVEDAMPISDMCGPPALAWGVSQPG
jgi:hypothetical protein